MSRGVSRIPYPFFSFTHFPSDISQYHSQKFVKVHKKMCQSGPPHNKNHALTHILTKWSEWQKWYLLNFYEHKGYAQLCARLDHILNSILSHVHLSIQIPILIKDIFAPSIELIFWTHSHSFGNNEFSTHLFLSCFLWCVS